MKKLLTILFGVVFIFLAAALIIPFVVNVDQYRPKLVQYVNEQINGTVELGRLDLSLWGQVLIDVDGIKIMDASGSKVLSVRNAHFHLPFTSVFSGQPDLNLRLSRPMVDIIKDKNGKINVVDLIKKKDAGQTRSGGKVELHPMIAQSRLSVEFAKARLKYVDLVSEDEHRIDELNFQLVDISILRPTQLLIWGGVSLQGGWGHVKGPIEVTGRFEPKFSGLDLDRILGRIFVNLDDVEINLINAFHKKVGVKSQAKAIWSYSKESAVLEDFVLTFHNAEVKAAGKVSNLGAGKPPVLQFKASSNEVDLAKWNELIPQFKEFDLSGVMRFDAEASGPSDHFDYRGAFKIKDFSAHAPQLKSRPVFNISFDVEPDRVNDIVVNMNAPGNRVSLTGEVNSFSEPRVDLSLKSQGMDLNQIYQFPEKKSGAGDSVASSSSSGSSGSSAGQSVDYDAQLDAFRSNRTLRRLALNLDVDIKKLNMRDLELADMSATFSFKNLVAALNQFKFKIWDGSLATNAYVNVKPKAPTYKFSTVVNQLDLERAVKAQLSPFGNTVVGKLDLKMAGTGRSLNPKPAQKNLVVKGNFLVKDAVFANIDVNRMSIEAINSSIVKVAEKVPQVAGKKVEKLPEGKARYKKVSSSFSLVSNKFSAPNFVAVSEARKGIDFKGATSVGLADESLKAQWSVIDTHNLTRAKDISIEEAGIRVDHILAERNQPVRFPVTVGCKLSKPCYTYTEVAEHFAKVAVDNVAYSLQQKAMEMKSQAEAEAKKKAKEEAARLRRRAEAQAKKKLQKAAPQVKKALERFGF